MDESHLFIDEHSCCGRSYQAGLTCSALESKKGNKRISAAVASCLDRTSKQFNNFSLHEHPVSHQETFPAPPIINAVVKRKRTNKIFNAKTTCWSSNPATLETHVQPPSPRHTHSHVWFGQLRAPAGLHHLLPHLPQASCIIHHPPPSKKLWINWSISGMKITNVLWEL